MIEVEAKFLVDDVTALEKVLRPLCQPESVIEYDQRDEYFSHPCRDFGQTDEALRLRTSNGHLELTYKGPKLDAVTKTREELELEIAAEDAVTSERTLRSILLALGFRPAGCVVKHRRSVIVDVRDNPVTVSIDHVSGLPTYAELETTCEPCDRETGTAMILHVADLLNLTQSERRSYLELLGFGGR